MAIFMHIFKKKRDTGGVTELILSDLLNLGINIAESVFIV